jgi:ABC-type transport system substrate-binding protein
MNLNRYPFSELWFRQALSKVIDQELIGEIASRSNWGIGSPTYLNVLNPDHMKYYNETIHDQYKFVYDVAGAVELMEANGCYKTAGQWYATVPAAKAAGLTDDDAATGGVNIALGPWDIITPAGWTDTTWAVEGWAEAITNNIGIVAQCSEVNFDNVWQPAFNAMTFDLGMWCSGPATVASAFDMWNSLGVAHTSPWGNPGNWTGAATTEIRDAVTEFANAATLAEAKAAANTIQTIYGQNIPTLPLHINCLWYQISDAKYKGWLTDAYDYQQALTEWVVDKNVIKQRLIMALVPADLATWDPPDVWEDVWINATHNADISNGTTSNITLARAPATTTTPGGDGGDGGIPFVGLPFMLVAGLAAAMAVMIRKRK